MRQMRHLLKNPQLHPEDAYLSYYDIRCTQSDFVISLEGQLTPFAQVTRDDVDTIKDDWLTDSAIAFWEEYLEHEILTKYPQANVVLLRPTMSFMLIQTPDPMTIKDALPSFSGVSHIFLPINDCRAPNIPEGGSHWSLLLVSLVDGMAFHYDSLHGSNQQQAQQTTNKLSHLVQRRIRFTELYDAPQQNNGSDCGVYVCMVMKYLLVKRLLSTHNNDKISMSMGSSTIDAVRGRKDMLRLIEEFRREGRRSMSRSRSPFGGRRSSDNPPRVGD